MILEIGRNFCILDVRASKPLWSGFFWIDICIASLLHFGTATTPYMYHVIDIVLVNCFSCVSWSARVANH